MSLSAQNHSVIKDELCGEGDCWGMVFVFGGGFIHLFGLGFLFGAFLFVCFVLGWSLKFL